MKLTLIRLYGNLGTNGFLIANKQLICKTIELPWRNNQPSVSCIPEGKYVLQLRDSERFGRHLEIIDVPKRSLILFHPANDALRELRGCIAPVTELVGQGMGTESRLAFRKLMDRLTPVLLNEELVTLNIQT